MKRLSPCLQMASPELHMIESCQWISVPQSRMAILLAGHGRQSKVGSSLRPSCIYGNVGRTDGAALVSTSQWRIPACAVSLQTLFLLGLDTANQVLSKGSSGLGARFRASRGPILGGVSSLSAIHECYMGNFWRLTLALQCIHRYRNASNCRDLPSRP